MEKLVNKWLNRYGKSYFDQDFGYSDCDMIDGAMHDLSLPETDRAAVGKLVDMWIAQKG